MKILSGLIFLILCTAPAYAALYKWVDEQGNVHYSDQAPSGKTKSDTTLNIPNQPAATPATNTAKSWQEKDLEYKKRQAAAAEAEAKQQKEAQDAKAKTTNCEQAKNNLARLKIGGRIFTYDDKGNRSYMDDAQRAKATADAQKSISDWCK